MKAPAIIIDLDGTLINNVTTADKYRDALFHEQIPFYVPEAWSVLFINKLARHTEILFITARSEEFRDTTLTWINKSFEVQKFGLCKLYMRPYNNTEVDAIVKEQIYHKHIKPYYNVLFAIDDKKSVVRMWRRKDIPTMRMQY